MTSYPTQTAIVLFLANVVKLGPVDVEIIGRTEIVSKMKETAAEHKPNFG